MNNLDTSDNTSGYEYCLGAWEVDSKHTVSCSVDWDSIGCRSTCSTVTKQVVT